LDVQTAPRRSGEFLKRGQWFSKLSRGGYEKTWCLGNPFPLYRLSQIEKTDNEKSFFHHLVTRDFKKIKLHVRDKHGDEVLNELEAGCLNESEVRHHATDHDEDLDEGGVFEENEPFPPNVMRPKDITDQEVRGFDDGEVLQRVHNVDQMLQDVEFKQVYTPSKLARLKEFIDDSTKASILLPEVLSPFW
jgi:hypothetical protein